MAARKKKAAARKTRGLINVNQRKQLDAIGYGLPEPPPMPQSSLEAAIEEIKNMAVAKYKSMTKKRK
jgi:hypothetical protein